MDAIIEKLIEYLPLWYVVLLAIVAYAVYFFFARFKPLESSVKDNSGDIKSIKGDVADIKGDIALIKSVLIQKYPKSSDIFAMKKSPRRLNPLGEKMFAAIDGEKFLCANKAFFFAKIDAEKPKTALDVENAAALACSASTAEDFFNPIKDYVYNLPSIQLEEGTERTYDLTLGDVCFILSIPLRDMYLAEHSKIN